MVVFGLSARRVVATFEVFAVSVASCAYGAGVAVADPQPMPDRWTQFVTDDGWVVDVNTTNEVINHIDNLAGASNSRQARRAPYPDIPTAPAGYG